MRGRKGAESRLTVVDLRERAKELEVALGAAALDVEVTLRNGVPTALVLLENGYIDAIPLVPTGARTSVYVPGAWRMALSEELGAAYVLAVEPGGASVVRLDLSTMAIEPAGLAVPGHGANELGIFGDGDGQWLYVIEAFARAGRRDTAVVDDRLWCARLEAHSGRLVEGSVSVHALGGFVRKVASR
jgi:hypothetical protein